MNRYSMRKPDSRLPHPHTQSYYVFLLDSQTGTRTRPLEQRSVTVATLILNNSVLIYRKESNLYFAIKANSDSLLHLSTNAYVYYLQIQYQQQCVRKSSTILVYRPIAAVPKLFDSRSPF